MHILVIDGNHVEAEFRQKFGPEHDYRFLNSKHESGEWPTWQQTINNAASESDVIFCFADSNGGNNAEQILPSVLCLVFVEIIRDSLINISWGVSRDEHNNTYVGFCGLPTLINRSLLEVSLSEDADRPKLAETCAALGTEFRVVEDRVGLVTPRVICQIINEACFTLQEGTASMQDIDLGMKLGTNYPHGPFAWANAIGVQRVYAVLEAMWNDTHDGRYKVCPLLKRQALRGEPFAV